MKKYIMVGIIIYNLFCITGYCQSNINQVDNVNNLRVSETEKLTEEDYKILQVALNDLATNKHSLISITEKDSNQIIINETTSFPSISEDVVTEEFYKKGVDIAPDVFVNYRNRNTNSLTISKAFLMDDHFIVDDFDKIREELFDDQHHLDFWDKVRKKYPKAKLTATASVPAYSIGSNKALIQISYGPISHGAFVIYYLFKEGTQWKVTSHIFVYLL